MVPAPLNLLIAELYGWKICMTRLIRLLNFLNESTLRDISVEGTSNWCPHTMVNWTAFTITLCILLSQDSVSIPGKHMFTRVERQMNRKHQRLQEKKKHIQINALRSYNSKYFLFY